MQTLIRHPCVYYHHPCWCYFYVQMSLSNTKCYRISFTELRLWLLLNGWSSQRHPCTISYEFNNHKKSSNTSAVSQDNQDQTAHCIKRSGRYIPCFSESPLFTVFSPQPSAFASLAYPYILDTCNGSSFNDVASEFRFRCSRFLRLQPLNLGFLRMRALVQTGKQARLPLTIHTLKVVVCHFGETRIQYPNSMD